MTLGNKLGITDSAELANTMKDIQYIRQTSYD